MITVDPQTSLVRTPTVMVVQAGLARLGWTLVSVEIDLSREMARIEVRHGDLRVTVKTVGRRGDQFRAEVVKTRFVGRTRHQGTRSGIRWLADYIAANAAVLPSDVRPLFALLMDGHLPSPA